MRSELGDKIRLQHILDAIDEIHTYLIAADLSIFLENSMMRFACIKQMEIIGEASNHLSTELKSRFFRHRMGSNCWYAKCICPRIFWY
jgi:uncharacterized protein with HEPN domain